MNGQPMTLAIQSTHGVLPLFKASATCLLGLMFLLLNGASHGGTPMAPADLNDFAQRYTAAWNSGNAASVGAFFAPDGSLFVNGSPAVGRDAITAVAAGFMTAFPDLELTLDALEIQTDSITYHWTFAGTNTGPEGTGNAVRFSGYEEWTFGDDDLIARSMGHFDNDKYQHQLLHGVESNEP
jgi:uncharacterized protein (TIGR02246 family)